MGRGYIGFVDVYMHLHAHVSSDLDSCLICVCLSVKVFVCLSPVYDMRQCY